MNIPGIFRLPRPKARIPRRPRVMGQPIGIDPMTRRAIEFGGAAELNVVDLELYSRLPPGVL